ncbi:unnamed protein product, partial [Adineta steineri]
IWTTTSTMRSARYSHTASILANGNVLVAGGLSGNGTALRSAELYNASTGLWTTVSNMSSARYYHTASILTNGNVLVVGGTADGSSALSSAEVYGL